MMMMMIKNVGWCGMGYLFKKEVIEEDDIHDD